MLSHSLTMLARGALVVGAALFGGAASPAAGQELAQVDRGPRFLREVAVGEPRVEMDLNSTPVLRRRISLGGDERTLGGLLSAIAKQAGLKLVYSADLLPADRAIRFRADSITVAAALTEVLVGAGVDVVFYTPRQVGLVKRRDARAQVGAIVGRVTDAKTQTALAGATVVVQGTSHSATTGGDGRYRIADVAPGMYTVRARYIGYAPGTASVTVSADQAATADLALEKSAQQLNEVVTTGTVVPTEVKALPTPVSVITGEEINEKRYQRLDQIFRGDMPGAIAWNQGPYDFYSTVSVRGASTLYATPGIKTFIDGIEVAEPTLIATIDPNSVERIEVIRGPQASTLYGAGALNGVMQIFTKKGTVGLDRPEIAAKVSAGGIGGYGGQSTALQTDNSLSVLGGGNRTSYHLGGSYRRLGEWAPSYHSADWSVSGGGETKQGPLTLSGSVRYADKGFDDPWDTRLQAYTPFSRPPFDTEHLRQQTYGVTGSVQATPGWQHTLTLGYDQSYQNFYQTQPQFTTPDDSLLSTFQDHQAKISLLYHTDLSLRLGPVATVATIGINSAWYDDVFLFTGGATRTTGSLDGTTSTQLTKSNNTGYFGQVQANLSDRLFVTAGLRAERNPTFGADFGTAWSPRVGAAYASSLGSATVKLRASYGESIRAPLPAERDATRDAFSVQLANDLLAPERQRGVDGGVELYMGRVFLGVTYYNQRAIDLIELATIPTAPDALPTYQYQNVSHVKNDGWEFETRLPLGRLQLAGTYSITNSTVRALPQDYSGAYQVGDRILGVPHTSAGATVTYSPTSGTVLTASMTHIGEWINFDYLSFYAFRFAHQPYRGSTRAYWMTYPQVTKFAVGASQALSGSVKVFGRAENVGNNLRYEQFNRLFNLPMPRSFIVGAELRY